MSAINTNTCHVTIHMVASLDGYIAKKDNSVSWFETTSQYDKGVVGVQPEEFLKKIDAYVMGAHTYEHALQLSKQYGWPYGDKPTIVITSRQLPKEKDHIEFYAGDLTKLVNDRLNTKYKNVWVVGGALLVSDFIRLQLAHEIRISMLPILLGEGKLFFDQLGAEHALELKDSIAYKNGMVELCYGFRTMNVGS